MPLQTMSYWNALMVSGSCVFSASSPPCGMLNGLWLKSIRPVSSFSSYIGKSVTQQKRNAPFPSAQLVGQPRAHEAGELRRRVLLAADEEHRIARLQPAGDADRLGPIGFQIARDRAFGAFGLEGDIAQAARPLGARPVVQLVEEAARLVARAGAGIARTMPPDAAIRANRPKPTRRNARSRRRC